MGAVDGGALAWAACCSPTTASAIASGATNRTKRRARRIAQDYLVGDLAAKAEFSRCGVDPRRD
jgi:hypothetical protein